MDPKHILLAEDEQYVRVSLSAILKKAGYEVTTVEDGREALEKIIAAIDSSRPVDLLLTDIRMPGISGVELIDELERLNIVIPILVITGYGDKELIIHLMRKGCADYIDKPFDPEELLERLPPIFEKTEKSRKASPAVQLIQEKEELSRQLESYIAHFEGLRKQMDSAKDAYRNLIRIREDSCKVRVAYTHQPLSELGGDFVDIRNTPRGCDIILADVAGHDMGASYHSIMIKAFFDENCRTGNDGQAFFRLLNRQLLENGRNERMVTAIFLRLDLRNRKGEVISAGHPPMMKLSKKIQVPEPLMAVGDVLGIHEEVRFEGRSFDFVSGDRFLLHTDGLINVCRPAGLGSRKVRSQAGAWEREKKARSPAFSRSPDFSRSQAPAWEREKLGADGLDCLIKKHSGLPLREMVTQIGDAVTEFCSHKFNDDMLLLGVEIPE